MMPKRIQRKRTKGWRLPPNTVCVSRPSRWGNPYRVGDPHPHYDRPISHEDAVALYRRFLLAAAVAGVPATVIRHALRGKNLACWCPLGKPCHADVLLEIANEGESDG